MKDSYILIATARNRKVRIMAADTTKMCEEARITHDLYPTANAALGRVMSIGAIMGVMLKEKDEKVLININGHGPLGTVMAEARSNGDVRGFVGDNTVYLKYNDTNKLAVGLAVGTDGYLEVTKYLNLKNNFTSKVALKSGEIGDDFAYYFAVSEQVPSLVSVGVLVDVDYSTKSAGALIIQLMPGHTESDIAFIENLKLEPISKMVAKGPSLEVSLKELFPDFELLEKRAVCYHCDCSKERFMEGIMSIPKGDLLELLNDEVIEVKCEYCNKKYEITKKEMLEFINEHLEHR